MANAEQIESWDGIGGEQWVAEQARYDRMNGGFGELVVAAVAARPGERILDVGCGNGALALALAPLVAPGGEVVGLDISGPQLRNAERRASEAGLDNMTFVKGDAQVHPLDAASFDAAVSRFGVMFFDDPVAAFTNIGGALRSGGRLAVSCWQDMFRNEWIMVPVGAALAHVPIPPMGEPGSPGPFSLADPDRVRRILDAAGFVGVEVEEVTAPMVMGSSVEDTVAFLSTSDIARALMNEVDDEVAARAWAAVAEALAPHETPDGVAFTGNAWLVTATKS